MDMGIDEKWESEAKEDLRGHSPAQANMNIILPRVEELRLNLKPRIQHQISWSISLSLLLFLREVQLLRNAPCSKY